MAQQLLSNLGKQGADLGLLTEKVDINDLEYRSKYFNVVEFDPVFTAGRNPIAFNGSTLLKDGSEIQVQCIDSNGNSLYIERAKATSNQFTDVSKFVISIHVYDEIYNGSAKLVLVGTTVLDEIVRWIGNITIDKTLTNASKVRFYDNPILSIRPLLYPVLDTNKASDQDPPPVYAVPSAVATIKSVVSHVTVTNAGSGYTATPNVSISSPGEGGDGAEATTTISGGLITNISVTNGGSGYTSIPLVTISGGNGTGGTATAALSSTVETISITSGGSGYDLGFPVVTISGGGGGGATAEAVVTAGVVTAINVTSGGSGYIAIPIVSFTEPQKPAPPDLNVTVPFSAEFYTYAVNPTRDTNKTIIDKKRIDVDYRLIATSISEADLSPTILPTNAFNSQMEGKTITLYISSIKLPSSYKEQSVNITSSFIIKKVIDSKTVILDKPYYYQVGKDFLITNIASGTCFVSYDFVKYNTEQESNLTFTADKNVTPVSVRQSYAEITYRNLKTFSGFVARHKLYRRSLFYPGDFQLISDEPLGAIELLSDTITFNRAYDQLGKFYNQVHIDKYWFPSSADLTLTAKTSPINSVCISGNTPSSVDGNTYIILKTDSIGYTNDSVYRDYDAGEFNNLSGLKYNSNFVSLKKNTLYALTMDAIMEKDVTDENANICFYFTSSIESIKKESNYDPLHGLKLGEISTKDKVSTKYFSGKQTFLFTPSEDYYGTLVMIPYHCNVTLSNVSLKVYGDYGFSPEALFIRVLFPINIKNEAFEFKAELFDINHNIIFSELKATQTFDVDGDTLKTKENNVANLSGVINTTTNTDNTRNVVVDAHATTFEGGIYINNLSLNEGQPQRFVGWQIPSGTENEAGKLVYTNVSKLLIDSGDYISVSTVTNNVESTARSLAIQYDGVHDLGRKIFVDTNNVKFRSPAQKSPVFYPTYILAIDNIQTIDETLTLWEQLLLPWEQWKK